MPREQLNILTSVSEFVKTSDKTKFWTRTYCLRNFCPNIAADFCFWPKSFGRTRVRKRKKTLPNDFFLTYFLTCGWRKQIRLITWWKYNEKKCSTCQKIGIIRDSFSEGNLRYHLVVCLKVSDTRNFPKYERAPLRSFWYFETKLVDRRVYKPPFANNFSMPNNFWNTGGFPWSFFWWIWSKHFRQEIVKFPSFA